MGSEGGEEVRECREGEEEERVGRVEEGERPTVLQPNFERNGPHDFPAFYDLNWVNRFRSHLEVGVTSGQIVGNRDHWQPSFQN